MKTLALCVLLACIVSGCTNVQAVRSSDLELMVATADVSILDQPYPGSTVIGSLIQGDSIMAHGGTGMYLMVYPTHNSRGWVQRNHLRQNRDTPTDGPPVAQTISFVMIGAISGFLAWDAFSEASAYDDASKAWSKLGYSDLAAESRDAAQRKRLLALASTGAAFLSVIGLFIR